ncbi:amidohydrolase family protein [Blastopirellula marina]|nr:amidohydrolase family protein [Blastopirellula marina]
MAISPEEYTEHDQRIWDEELEEFVPSRIFDAHIHLFDRSHVGPEHPCGWLNSDLATIRAWAERLYPGREVHFLVLGTPVYGIDVQQHAQWQIEQVRQDPLSRVNRLVTPACTCEEILCDVQQAGVIGLKPYRIFSQTGDIAECRIQEFFTDAQLSLADEHGLWVTMHLSRFNGAADEENLRDLEEYTLRRYPGIKWILAHCARSFTYWPIRQAIERLRELPNIWYDVSAVTDVRPLITLFSQEDTRRILFGSDGVDATYFHGQYAALGRAWQALDVSQHRLSFPHCDGRPILAIYEQLLSMKHAAEIVGLSKEAISEIFWGNAVKALEIEIA